MNEPQSDPCASIREAIAETRDRIKSDTFDLTHPEDLTAEQEVSLRQDLAQAKAELAELRDELKSCVEQHSEQPEKTQVSS